MDKLINGLLVMLIGLVIVFFGLCLLIMLIKAMTALTNNMGKKKEKTAPVPAVTETETAEEEEDVTDDGEIVAAITAAITCMMGDGSRFVVRHVRRLGSR